MLLNFGTALYEGFTVNPKSMDMKICFLKFLPKYREFS
jgi:hypothetical protein